MIIVLTIVQLAKKSWQRLRSLQMLRELRIVSGWFLDLDGNKPVCAFKNDTSCTPDCVACEIIQESMQSVDKVATCLRGPFDFASIVE
jgi:hypothetical protein